MHPQPSDLRLVPLLFHQVLVTFNGRTYPGAADASGDFDVQLNSCNAGVYGDLVVQGKDNNVTVHNVACGQVSQFEAKHTLQRPSVTHDILRQLSDIV